MHLGGKSTTSLGQKSMDFANDISSFNRKKTAVEMTPVGDFNFEVEHSESEYEDYHQNQLNWLNNQCLARIIEEERQRDFIEQSSLDLKTTIDDLTKWLEKIDREGNEWKARFENQCEINNNEGIEILKLTDKIENLKADLNTSEPLMKKYDHYSEIKWRKLLKKAERDRAKLDDQYRDVLLRLEQEAKAYFKVNTKRTQFLSEMNLLNHYEAEELRMIREEHLLETEAMNKQRETRLTTKAEKSESRRNRTADRSQSPTNSHSRFGNYVPKSGRTGGRFKGRITPRDSGIGNLSRGYQQAHMDHDADVHLRRGVHGSGLNVNRRGGPDPVAALFATTQNDLPAGYGYVPPPGSDTGRKSALKRSNSGKTSRTGGVSFKDSHSDSDIRSRNTSRYESSRNLQEDRRILDPRKGPVKKSAATKKLPTMTSTNNKQFLNSKQRQEIERQLQKPANWK